jgi:signal transduction histidine kinase
MTPLHERLPGYVAALAIPIAMMVIGTRIGMPAFVFEHLVILFVVAIAVLWGMAPAVLAALAAALGDNVILRDPMGRPTITGLRDVLDLVMFVVVAVTVGWLVASARRDREKAQAAADRERNVREDHDRLVAMVSHDIATPLSVIRASIQFARRAGIHTVDPARIWDRVDSAAARAATLVRTLGDARMLDSGELTLERRRCDLRDVIAPVAGMMDRASERHPVLLTLAAERLAVTCDADRLQCVFENLLSNAIKYSPDGGLVEVSAVREETEAVVTVTDCGMGISVEALPHVFERGYRAREAVTTAQGLGLGLSISAEIVKRHGGSIDVHRRDPRGSTVVVRLPLAPEPMRATPGVDAEAEDVVRRE